MLDIRGSLLKAHWSVHIRVNSACSPPGYILWLAVWCLMKCVFTLHLLVLYKLSLSAGFCETSLRFLLVLNLVLLQQDCHTVSLVITHTYRKELLNLYNLRKNSLKCLGCK